MLHFIGIDNVENFDLVPAKRNQKANSIYHPKFCGDSFSHESIHKENFQVCHNASVDIKNSKINAALMAEIYYGHIENCKLLIERGALFVDKDYSKRSPLFYAAYLGKVEVCELLIIHGEVVDEKDSYGQTPLFPAAYRGNTDVCKLLINLGATVDLIDFDGATPLLMAAFNGHFETCKLLVSHVQMSIKPISDH